VGAALMMKRGTAGRARHATGRAWSASPFAERNP
jgi:hypothetical protein